MTTIDSEAAREQARLSAETEALRLLRDGYSGAQVQDKTGVTPARLQQLARDFPGIARRPAATPLPNTTVTTTAVVLPAVLATTVEELIEQGNGHSQARVRTAAKRASEAVDRLRERIAEPAEAEREAQAQRQRQEAARKALDAAKEQLRTAQEAAKAAGLIRSDGTAKVDKPRVHKPISAGHSTVALAAGRKRYWDERRAQQGSA